MRSSCPICLDLFDGCSDVGATPCGHVFHSKCILKWMGSSKLCPECRGQIARTNILKLFFNTPNGESFNITSLENDLESKKSDLKSKDAELASVKGKVKALQKHCAITEENLLKMQQKYLLSQSELEFAKIRLKEMERMEAKIKNLVKDNQNLQNQIDNLHHIQVVAQGSQQEVEDILREQGALLAEQVGNRIAKNIATFCSILKRELRKVADQKDQLKKDVIELNYQLGLRSAKLKRVQKSYAELERQFKSSSITSSPFPRSTESGKSTQLTPTSASSGNRAVKKVTNSVDKDKKTSEVTPISVNFSERKRPDLDIVVLDKLIGPSSSSVKSDGPNFAKAIKPKKREEMDEDSVLRIGYNGLGGHGRVIFAKSRELMNTKPYKKNPNVKKIK